MLGVVEVVEVREDERVAAQLTKRMLTWVFTFTLQRRPAAREPVEIVDGVAFGIDQLGLVVVIVHAVLAAATGFPFAPMLAVASVELEQTRTDQITVAARVIGLHRK